jgi:nucleotide-binding universal stress UspA family protein
MSHFPPRTILAALDGGDASHRATAIAALVAGRTGATLDVLHVTAYDAPAYFTSEQIDRLEAEHALARQAARDRVAGDLEARGVRPDDIVVVDAAVADEVILEHAPQYDLVCMGTHGRRGARRWWLGSVAERVALGAPVPVLVVRAEASADPALFSRIAVTAPGGAPRARAYDYARGLADAFHGTVEEIPALDACPASALERASLVVVERRTGDRDASFATASLRECGRPMLFLPAAAGLAEELR